MALAGRCGRWFRAKAARKRGTLGPWLNGCGILGGPPCDIDMLNFLEEAAFPHGKAPASPDEALNLDSW